MNKYRIKLGTPINKVKFYEKMTIVVNRGIAGPSGTNGLDGSVASPTPTSVVDGTTYTIPAGKKLDSISVVPDASARVITLGYSASAGDLLDAEEIEADDSASFQIGRYFHSGKTIHFSGFEGSVLIYLF